MDLIQEAVDILAEREIAYAERFVPYMVASYGCHRFNLVNRYETQAYMFQGRTPDVRSQMLFTAPPGWSKSLYIRSLLSRGYGLFRLGDIPMRFATSVTEAAWTGSVDGAGANAVEAEGLAKKMRRGIVGMEEFAAITTVMKQEHSKHLEQALAMSLFGGHVQKDLKNLTIDYHTDITLWAGNQVLKFDLGGGLFRRFFHIFWVPRLEEAEVIAEKIWTGDNVQLNLARLNNYRTEVDTMNERLKGVEHVSFDVNLREKLRGIAHFEQLLYKNFSLGYTIMCDTDLGDELHVELTPKLEEYLTSAIEWRKQLLADPSGYQVQCLIYDLVERTGRDDIPMQMLREKNLLYSTDYSMTGRIVKRLRARKAITVNSAADTVTLR